MIQLFINALAASAGGGLTYIRNVLPQLVARDDVRTTLLVSSPMHGEVKDSGNVVLLQGPDASGSARRFWYEQRCLPALIHRSRANVLLSTGNFALFRSPVPQILLSRNALYRSVDFLRDLHARGDYRAWVDTELKSAIAKWSIQTADRTVAPSAAFAHELQGWTGKDVICIHHGFDREAFFGDRRPLSPAVCASLAATDGSLRLLFVSHYNYYRNFETLIRATAILKERLHPRRVRLILTCRLSSKQNPGNYQAEGAAALVNQLKVRDEVVELGAVPYASLHHLYRACDLYVTPAYAETFAHPLVEAMASALPVVASDLPVHREICDQAALYFPRFSPELLAQRVVEASCSAELRKAMQEAGIRRSQDFSWARHVDELLKLARGLCCSEPPQTLGVHAIEK
ncbi:MAG: glycosyltransferase family 1 protein [Candidatus Sulfotelmatobacter sp.]